MCLCNDQSHDRLLPGDRPAATSHPPARANRGRTSSPRATRVRRHYRNSVRETSGGRKNAATESERNEFRIRIGTVARTHLALTSSRPGHTRVSPPSRTGRRVNARRSTRRTCTPLVGASALHGVSGNRAGSHLGSTLKPGGAVLTRGVSRRSGSVAYIRADASPTEVLAVTSWHRKTDRVKLWRKLFTAHLPRSCLRLAQRFPQPKR
jgi:hypothetical protein